MDEVSMLKEIVAVMDKHGVAVQMRLPLLMGIPVGVMKSQGFTDAQVWEAVKRIVDGALAGAKVEAQVASAAPKKPAGKPVRR